MCESPPIAGDTNFCGLIVTEDEEIVVLLSNVFRYEFSASKFSFNSFIFRYSYLSAADSICFSSANCFNVKSLSSNFVCLPISKSYKRLKRSISFCSSLIFDCDSYLMSFKEKQENKTYTVFFKYKNFKNLCFYFFNRKCYYQLINLSYRFLENVL